MKDSSFIRIDSSVRNRLRRYCKTNGLTMGPFVSAVLDRFLKRKAAKKP